MRPLFLNLALSLLSFTAVKAGFPSKIYGVNLGSWLLLEPWMLPAEWLAMGGEHCDDCSTCIASEFAFVEAHGQEEADRKFSEHWNSWFNEDDVHRLRELNINAVRIPLGFWIVEDLVDRNTEFYPRGGLAQLRRGLKQLKRAGIVALLDHHALPGVQDPGQQFAGRCTNDVQFYTPYNYHRALVWTAVMTTLSHVDPAFSNVVSIEAVNEEIMDSAKTPDYGEFSKSFVQVIRAVEFLLGIPVVGLEPSVQAKFNSNVTISLGAVSQYSSFFNDEVCRVLEDAVPILLKLGVNMEIYDLFSFSPVNRREPLVTTFMDIGWQWGDSRSNPADAAMGPQMYDNHLYYSFGGVADANEEAYMTHICNLDRIEKDAALGNTPLFFGEWALPTQFEATDDFLFKWADAQKLQYSKDAGWFFWNFKIEISDLSDKARQWSYFEGVRRGYLTEDPSELHNPYVCDAYVKDPGTVTGMPFVDVVG